MGKYFQMTTKLKIKDSLYILKDSGENYFFVSTATRRIKKFQVDSLVKDIISSLDSELFEQDLIKKLSLNYNTQDITLYLQNLEKEGIIRRYKENLKEGKYHRQLLFLDELTNSREETLELQRGIENSRVAVFGIGGIGTWIVNSLY